MSTAERATEWVDACSVDDVPTDRGVALLIGDEPVAVFRLAEVGELTEEWHAVDHVDPVVGVPVIARGLVGSIGEGASLRVTVASPIHKQRYDLTTGAGLDDETALRVWPVKVSGGRVLVGIEPRRTNPPSVMSLR